MSSLVIISIKAEDEASLQRIERIAYELGLGVFWNNRYIEPFEIEFTKYNDGRINFSIADNCEFNNCEHLLFPWWFDNYNKQTFKSNMLKLSHMLEFCLKVSSYVDIFIGTSGDSLDDFKHRNITLQNFVDQITNDYLINPSYCPPSVRYTVFKN